MVPAKPVAAFLAALVLWTACGGEGPGADPAGENAVTVQVFSDPQCWACRQFYLENLRPAVAELGAGALTVEHHLYPLSHHDHAREASLYVLAGDRLGPGGPDRVLGALFETQLDWAEDGDVAGALAASFSPAELALLRREAATAEVAAALERETELAKQYGVSTTPTVFVVSGGERQLVPSTVQYPIFLRYLKGQKEG